MARAGPLRWGWSGLAAAIPLFIFGYASFTLLHRVDTSNATDPIVALILFLAASFVLGFAFLSRQTTKDVLRIGALEHDALVDPLTGLFNRRHLFARLDEEIARAHRYGLALSILLFDIDHFKWINDDHGHQSGDSVLQEISAILRAQSRPSDIVARYGGEELMIIATNTYADAAFTLAERIRRAIKAAKILSTRGTGIPVTTSVGVTSLLPDDDASALIARADQALYEAKKEGRDRTCVSQGRASYKRE
ncbi:MAG: GGDEF domain-containing protein [Methylovirgula sp.]